VGGGGVECVGDGLSQLVEPVGQVQVRAEPGLVEPGVDGADLAAQGGDLRGLASALYVPDLRRLAARLLPVVRAARSQALLEAEHQALKLGQPG
jgi:hypothetical protein